MINSAVDFDPPVFSPVADQILVLPESLTIQFTATDPNDDDLVFTALHLPLNASLDSKSGLFSFQPTNEQTGAFSAVIEVSDGYLRDVITVAIGVFDLGDCKTEQPTVFTTSPSHGTRDVAVTRETVVRFSQPLSPFITPQTDQFTVRIGETRLVPEIHLSSDRRTVILFYLDLLPAAARVRLEVDGSSLFDMFGCQVDADGDGTPGGLRLIEFDTLGLTGVSGTDLCGRVFDSQAVASGSSGAVLNQPIDNVKVSIDGLEETHVAFTDAMGNFRLEDVPAGTFFVHIDGRHASGLTGDTYYPNVGKPMMAVAGRENHAPDIFLPLIAEGTLQQVSQTSPTEIRFPDAVIAENPELTDVNLTVPAGSLFDIGGTTSGSVGIAPVNPERLPGPLPNGLDFGLVITVQTDGAQNFDIPAAICFPNLPDPATGQPLPPGASSALWSFNHDSGKWEVIGPMTVSNDGNLVCTDEGVGVLAPGWHGQRPGTQGGGGGPDGNGPPLSEAAKDCEEELNKTDPIYFFSGEFYLEANDLWIKGRGFDFAWTRKYRSRFGQNTVQGNGWDFGFNLRIFEDGVLRVFCDGNSRQDRFYPVPGSPDLWRRNEYFSDLIKNEDGSYTLHLETNERWDFAALDSAPGQGKITSKTDRNGNEMHFEYDAQGRLFKVIDTLDREILIGYNAAGFIASITDFTGRTVSYDYYEAGNPDGSPGDLKSVTLPAITGTPNGNDFPQGKTTTYTYSKGFGDERLNHNLLTMTDPKGQTFLRNTYETTPGSISFDRAIRQAWGDETDFVNLDYARIEPQPQFASAVTRTIVNDRVGNVSEYYYDFGNRQVLMRQFTGRADADQVTTADENRPTGKLRSEDPDFYETRYEYNQDSLRRRIIYPNGNIKEFIYESDLNPAAPARLRGNLRTIRRLPGSHEPGGDQEAIEEHYEYNPDFGCSSCGFNFITRQIDGKGNETLYEYDDRGNRTKTTHRIGGIVEEYEYNSFGQITAHIRPDNGSGIRRRDEYTYFEAGIARGYMEKEIQDADNLSLTKTMVCDAVGNVLAITDPRGNTTDLVYNQFNQLVQEITAEVTPGSGVRYTTNIFYDANDNNIRRDTENRDATGVLDASNPFISQIFDHEILNNVSRVTLEIDGKRSAVTEYEYDANRNRILQRFGEASNGNQPAQTAHFVYDERDLIFREILAQGHASQVTKQYDYDANGNQVRMLSGLEDQPRTSHNTYDGFNRRVSTTDPMGNRHRENYDANGNVVRSRLEGELLDEQGSDENVILSDTLFTFDHMDRLTETKVAFFNSDTGENIGDGFSNTTRTYSHFNQLISETDDNGNQTQYLYDSANRLVKRTDAKGNTSEYSYDGNDNILSLTETEMEDLGNGSEVFINTFTFDQLNRQTSHTNSVDSTATYAWDSRDNRTVSVDALGNKTLSTYDGLNRLLSQTKILTQDGTGAGKPVGQISTSQVWDDSNRLVSQTDDNGNTTTYGYDPLDRPIRTSFPDDTNVTRSFDVHGNNIALVDANGNLITNQFDLLNRQTFRQILPGGGVAHTTTYELLTYDGLSRLIHAENDDSLVTRSYDSLANIIRETINGQTTQTGYDGMSNRTSCTYPGGRTITCRYDPLNHLQTIREADADLVRFDYVGPIRTRLISFVNQTQTEITYNGVTGQPNQPGDFGERRISRKTHRHLPSKTVLDDRIFTWDRKHNKTMRRNQLTGDEDHYLYDSIYRMVESQRSGGASVTYDFDGVHNRLSVAGGTMGGLYELDGTSPTPADAQVNQYTTTPFDRRNYDLDGNLVKALSNANQQVELKYDYRNQLVTIRDEAKATVAHYAYDALGRRIIRQVNRNSDSKTTQYFYDMAHVIEEQDEHNQTLATYIYGLGYDQVLSIQKENQNYFFHSDDLNNTTALSDHLGNIVERYDYDDFGKPHFLNSLHQPVIASTVNNPYLFNGRRFDPESNLYYYRTRYLDPSSGRFISRDTLGAWGDAMNLGNSFTYAGNNPWSFVDPTGEVVESGWDAFSVSVGMTAMAYDWQQGNYGMLFLDMLGLAADTAAALTPGVPGGIGPSMQSIRGVNYANRARKVQVGVQTVHTTVDVTNAINTLRDPCATLLQKTLATIFAGVGVNGMRGSRGPRSKGNDIPPRVRGCFAAGTMILMADGSEKPIESIQAGDEVWADDPSDNLSAAPVKVLGLSIKQTLRFFKLHIDEDSDGIADGAISATGEHPFFLITKGWTMAETIKPGDVLLSSKKRNSTVVSVEIIKGFNRTFNLNTSPFDTFFVVVNDHAVLVHNGNNDIVDYGDKAKDFFNHHPYMHIWLEANLGHLKDKNGDPIYRGRSDKGFPTIQLDKLNHNAAHRVEKKYIAQWKKKHGLKGRKTPWNKISGKDITEMTILMLDAAGVPKDIQDKHYSKMVKYLAAKLCL